MQSTSSELAVLFIVFNRPQKTILVFNAIRQAKPTKLYIAADGSRKHVPEDEQKCKQVKDIVQQVDWDCKVYTLFQTENKGCKNAIIEALNWFFENEEEGIILEDDCLPSSHFFRFCSALLKHYRHDERVMHIAGTNLQFGNKRGDASYYFSRIASVWGWASWKRVWRLNDPEMKLFPQFEKEDQMINIFPDRRIADWVTTMARNVYEEKIITWDYRYAFSVLCNNGLCITPNVNLVSNIGFDESAARTIDSDNIHANIKLEDLTEVTHPDHFISNTKADLFQLSLSMNNVKKSEIGNYKYDFLNHKNHKPVLDSKTPQRKNSLYPLLKSFLKKKP